MNAVEFKEYLPELEAIRKEDLRRSKIPLDIALQEAEKIEEFINEYREALLQADVTEEQLNHLERRIELVRYAQAQWVSVQFQDSTEAQSFEEEAEEGYQLRDELVRDCGYAFRKFPDLSRTIARIAEGDGPSDLIQDLLDLAVVGEKNLELLRRIKRFDPAKLEEARTLSQRLSELLAQSQNPKQDPQEVLELRDRAYTYLDQLVCEIREAADYLFADDDEIRLKFHSEYQRKLRKRARRRSPEKKRKDIAKALAKGAKQASKAALETAINESLSRLEEKELEELHKNKSISEAVQTRVLEAIPPAIEETIRTLLTRES